MTSTDSSIRALLKQAASTYHRTLDADVAKSWTDAMKPYPAEKVKRAFSEYLRSSSYFPTPADIIRIIQSLPAAESRKRCGECVEGFVYVGENTVKPCPCRGA